MVGVRDCRWPGSGFWFRVEKPPGSESSTNSGAWEVVGCPAGVERDSLLQCGPLDIWVPPLPLTALLVMSLNSTRCSLPLGLHVCSVAGVRRALYWVGLAETPWHKQQGQPYLVHPCWIGQGPDQSQVVGKQTQPGSLLPVHCLPPFVELAQECPCITHSEIL